MSTSLSDEFHLVAPDYSGFGFSDFLSVDRFEYSFENIAGHHRPQPRAVIIKGLCAKGLFAILNV